MGFKENGITVLVTSHLLEQIQEVCDRVGIMAHGRMVREGRLDDLIAAMPRLVAAQPKAALLLVGGGPMEPAPVSFPWWF
jgi:ABC-type multidrug transport system ATPase subunit